MKHHTYTTKDLNLRIVKSKGAVTGRDLEALGIPRQYVQALYTEGYLERVGRGVCVSPGANFTEHHTLVEATRLVPKCIVCLLTALRFHNLTTQNPHEVWLSVEQKA
jgi:predicted transcriptional regulator of viral defense system